MTRNKTKKSKSLGHSAKRLPDSDEPLNGTTDRWRGVSARTYVAQQAAQNNVTKIRQKYK